ncbi:MAG: hypothetical protein J2P19_25720 [Pseudonocardia sp.]|nr:hypothetical protein [Pseudonocardia sp.]
MATERRAPASATPLRDYVDAPCPGASEDYLVVPRSLAQSMPLRWQQVFTGLLADLHDAYRELEWPEYRVVPSRREPLTDLDEQQLAAAGYVADLDADGGLIFRDAAERPVANPHALRVLAPIVDPIPPRSAGRVEPRPADDRAGAPGGDECDSDDDRLW